MSSAAPLQSGQPGLGVLPSEAGANWEGVTGEQPHEAFDLRRCKGVEVLPSHSLEFDSVVSTTLSLPGMSPQAGLPVLGCSMKSQPPGYGPTLWVTEMSEHTLSSSVLPSQGNRPPLCYSRAVCILEGNILSASRVGPCGSYPHFPILE